MSDLTDRIAYKLWECDVKGLIGVGGDWTPLSEEIKGEYRAKARAIEAELQLTEEHRTLTDGWIQPTRNAVYYAMGMSPPPAVITHESRWVSAWSEVDK